MKFRIILAIFIATALPAAASAKTPDTLTQEQLRIIYSLADRPLAAVDGNTCYVRGAVWAFGPRAGVRQALIDVKTGDVFGATTQANGVYALSIPYHGTPRVLQERIADQVYADKAIAGEIVIKDGGVVCDHRLQQTFPLANKEGVK